MMNSLNSDPRLEIDPTQLVEVPFDKIANPTTFATIEGSILATIRTYLADFFIRAMPVLTNIEINKDNYKEIANEYGTRDKSDGLDVEMMQFVLDTRAQKSDIKIICLSKGHIQIL